MRVLVTGGSGTLGRYLLAALAGADVVAPSHAEMDVTDAGAVRAWMRRARPELVLHAAALIRSAGANQAERAVQASRVNVLGTAHVAAGAAEVGARLLYVSTDFVFDGAKPGGLYREEDPPCPLGTYALTKYAAEQLALGHPDAVAVRTSFNDDRGWPYPRAFVDRFTSKRRASEVAQVLVRVAQGDLRGVLHAGGPRRSYFEFARTLTPDVQPMTLADVPPGSDPTPVDTSLDSSRLAAWLERGG